MEPEMFLPSTILVTWHNILITWSVARMRTITLKRSIGFGPLRSLSPFWIFLKIYDGQRQIQDDF